MPTQNKVASDFISIVKMHGFTFLLTYGYSFPSAPSELVIFECSTGQLRRIFAQSLAIEQMVLKGGILLTGHTSYKEALDTKEPELFELRIEDNRLELRKAAKY